MKKIIFFICLMIVSIPAFATTYYVRDGGGTSTRCTGTTDAIDPGSGSAQPCAFSHPAWALGTNGGGASIMVGGDTLLIHHISDSGGQAKYQIGYGMPNTGGSCTSSAPYNCVLNSIPAGTSNSPTKILGDNYSSCPSLPSTNIAQLWGSGNVYKVIDANNNYLDIECLEITDHSNQSWRVGDNQCNESYPNSSLCARAGISETTGNGITGWILKNLEIHGMADRGILAGGLNGLTATNLYLTGNSASDWDFDISSSCSPSPSCESSSGSLVFNNLIMGFGGFVEEYPVTHTLNDPSSILEGNDQNVSGGYGDCLGSNTTGGDWYFYNSDISHCTQDGLDLLYHTQSSGSLHIYGSRMEGSTGQQVKTGAPVVTIENSKLIGNCQYAVTSGITLNPTSPGSFVTCRAAGSVLVQNPSVGTKVRLINDTIWGEDGTVLEQGESGGTENCVGTESMIVQNSIIVGESSVSGSGSNSSWYYCSGTDGNGAGACCTGAAKIVPLATYTDIYNTKDAPVSGTGNLNVDPLWKIGSSLSPEPQTNIFDVTLKSTSTVSGVASNGSIFEYQSNDYNGQRRPPWDMGAYIYGSYADPGGTLSVSGTTINTKMTIGK